MFLLPPLSFSLPPPPAATALLPASFAAATTASSSSCLKLVNLDAAAVDKYAETESVTVALGAREEGEEDEEQIAPPPPPSTTAEREAPLGSRLSTSGDPASHLLTKAAIRGPLSWSSSSLRGKVRETARGEERHEEEGEEEGEGAVVVVVEEEDELEAREALPLAATFPPPTPIPALPQSIAAVLAALLSFTITHSATILFGRRCGSAASSRTVVLAGSTRSTTPDRNLEPPPR